MIPVDVDREAVERWLAAYGRAWENKDTQAFVGLFVPELEYCWTPFEEPKRGSAELARAFDEAVARQEDIRFQARVLAVEGDTALAHWSCAFRRIPGGWTVRLDGMFQMEFEGNRCRVFREWWHSDEPS